VCAGFVVSSHVIPAQIYDYCRSPGDHPITLTTEVVMATDRQLQAYLHWLECEDT
jgi:hypothetical protein